SRHRSRTAISAEATVRCCREPQVRHLSDVPRAVFEACSARPRWAEFATHRCEPRQHLAVGTALRCRRQGLVPPTCGGGSLQLGPPERGVRLAPLISHSPATALRSRLSTPREAPSVGPACA